MPTTYSLRTRILSSKNPFNNLYDSSYNNSSSLSSYNDSSNSNSSNYWILITLLIILTLVAIFVGGIYKTGYYENFEDSSKTPERNYTLYYFFMDACKWCDDFSNGAWKKLEDDMKQNSKDYYFNIKKVNINNSDDKDGIRLARKYNVNSTPTLILVDNSNEDNYDIFDKDRNIIEDLKAFGNKYNKKINN